MYYLRDSLHKLSEEVSALADDMHVGDKEELQMLRILKEYIQRISNEMSMLDSQEDEGEK